MNDLRWILIAGGALLLIGIYLWGRRSDRRADAASEGAVHVRPEPLVEPAFESPSHDLEDDDSLARDEPAYEPLDEPEPVIRAAARSEAAERSPVREQGASRTDASLRPARGIRVEPTLGENDAAPADIRPPADPDLTAELPAREPVDAPTLGMSSTPAPRRIERRKIIALRLAAPGQRFPGEALRTALEGESLQFGRYDVFHRLHDDGTSIFSVASMMEPGTFELERMPGQQYSGVTLFAQLPGPVPGVQALQDLVACGKQLQEGLGGTLQDERGVPLTVHRIDRLRQEIVDFERGQARDQRSIPTSY
ncbi:MAG TPA: cell division protein ZipA C-terminal FtsZ-binding domain-containing protein [Povalibacter sp.]|uniref:cell division protein ZipA C-terminal FtsZ-binding domain-containing protein n=1 Tax=Povalibacter sp. TaxID=1962978 RepID=UPI002C30D090|nr:cell division protein ZipA C-terminal FtsZ-binding domain-containing protein [Povalibacter sp.]HMN45728.1 cell division protein ZipA C-terminal FtsZ-binding domain-containing protein [Povalibacter sp.]